MRMLLGALLVALHLAAGFPPLQVRPALADEASDRLAALDDLFARLRVAPDAATARAIDQQIWTHWTTPAQPELARRMREVLDARSTGEIGTAMALVNQVVQEFPDYSEGWNQRATLYFMLGDFEHSIEDCARVLELEPRHFGALSGRALIYLQLGQRALALKDMAAALAIHPFLREAALFPELSSPVPHA